ncbi:MAG: 23S rRNA (adenine(2503)-C(2))-methyltransferase RlmN [Candidatus Hydrogenedentota bacterium]
MTSLPSTGAALETPPHLTGLTPETIAARLDVPAYRGKQIFQWLHQRGVFDFEQMTDLPKELRARLAESVRPGALTPSHFAASAQSKGTKKALFTLEDGETVETVLIRDRERMTVCVSSQVGCAVKCAFCATGMSGYKRNLSAGEIAEQVPRILADEDLGDRNPNIVYMGMGEPFRNYEAVTESIRLLMRKEGQNIGARRITVSTVGEAGGIRAFAEEPWQVRLSVSLHAANDALRSELVPLNRKYPLRELRKSILDYNERSGRRITFEWTLMEGVNDSPHHADELAEFAQGVNAGVNLIPYNPVASLAFTPSPRAVCEAFQQRLENHGIRATLRRERGQDIDAACGQLRRRHTADT